MRRLRRREGGSATKGLLHGSDGVAAIEFAFVLPLLLLLSFGMIELVRYVQFNQKMDAGASQLTNIVNQNLNLTLADLNIIMDATTEIISPFDGNDLTIAITAIQQNDPIPDSPADVMWQVGQNLAANTSLIAPDGKGSTTKVPGVTLVERDQIIAVEVFNRYTPLLDNEYTRAIVDNATSSPNYKIFIGRPRYGSFQFEPK